MCRDRGVTGAECAAELAEMIHLPALDKAAARQRRAPPCTRQGTKSPGPLHAGGWVDEEAHSVEAPITYKPGAATEVRSCRTQSNGTPAISRWRASPSPR